MGAAFAKELTGRGMNLVLVARSIDTLQDLADSIGAQYCVRCVVLQADLATSDAVKRIMTELERPDLKIDLLINNAGLGLAGDFLSHEASQLSAIRRWASLISTSEILHVKVEGTSSEGSTSNTLDLTPPEVDVTKSTIRGQDTMCPLS